MIMKFLKKIPAGMMVVPMLLGAFINTFFPQITGIGSFTTAVFTSAGANTAIGIQLFCLGTTLQFREMGGVVKRYPAAFQIRNRRGNRHWCGQDLWSGRIVWAERTGDYFRRYKFQRFRLPRTDEQLR